MSVSIITGDGDPRGPYGPRPEPTYLTCGGCGRTFHSEDMHKSRLTVGIYCDGCMTHLIEDEEREYPGDEGNHKMTDFKPYQP